jgi:glycosyltransferase 2 family protein
VTASGRLTRSAMPSRIRRSVVDVGAVMSALRVEVLKQTGALPIKPEQITRLTRNQILQLVLLIGLVYVAYPYISAIPTLFTQLRTANWWWALLGLWASALTYLGAPAALCACASGLLPFRHLAIMQVANTFAATTTAAVVGFVAAVTCRAPAVLNVATPCGSRAGRPNQAAAAAVADPARSIPPGLRLRRSGGRDAIGGPPRSLS